MTISVVPSQPRFGLSEKSARGLMADVGEVPVKGLGDIEAALKHALSALSLPAVAGTALARANAFKSRLSAQQVVAPRPGSVVESGHEPTV